MIGRILVVDDILANVRLLEAKLAAEYFEISTAMNGHDALASIENNPPDLIILDVMMPSMDGIEVVKKIRSNPKTSHIPIILLSALDQPEDRIRGLQSGADDFLTKPANFSALLIRIKALIRQNELTNILSEGSSSNSLSLNARDERAKSCIVVSDSQQVGERISQTLGDIFEIARWVAPQEAAGVVILEQPNLVIADLGMQEIDGLRFCSHVKASERGRTVPILVLAKSDEHQQLLRALEIGVSDYLIRPIDAQELKARVQTQLKRAAQSKALVEKVSRAISNSSGSDAPPGNIFLSYRRLDTQHIAGRIFDRLASEFGESNVVFDINSVPIGTDFQKFIEGAIRSSIVMLAIIGRKWINPEWVASPPIFEDYVLMEIETALKCGTPVIPVLVDNTRMPAKHQLPQTIQGLTKLNAALLRSARDFKADINRLAETINNLRNRR